MKLHRIARHLLFWLIYMVLTTALYTVQDPDISLHFSYELASLPAKALLTYASIYWLLPRYILPKKYGKAIILYTGMLISAVFLLQLLVRWLVYPHFFPEQGFEPFGQWGKMVSPLLDLLVVSFAATAIKLVQNREEIEKRRLLLAKINAENELHLLKSQLHPHFLFNTLNGLYAQINDQPEQAAAMVVQLSHLLRYIIYEASRPTVLLADELDSLHHYIALEKIRFSQRLQMRWTVEGEVANKRIAPLIILPFLENTFKHGPARQNGTASIDGHLVIYPDQLHMILKNSFDPTFREDTVKGTGLENVQKRLRYLYGENFTLHISELHDCFQVELTIPLYDEMRNH